MPHWLRLSRCYPTRSRPKCVNYLKTFIGTNVDQLFSKITNCQWFNKNDADGAGFAEIQFGAGVGQSGVLLLITIGTELGAAIFTDGTLAPNTELGHLFAESKYFYSKPNAKGNPITIKTDQPV